MVRSVASTSVCGGVGGRRRGLNTCWLRCLMAVGLSTLSWLINVPGAVAPLGFVRLCLCVLGGHGTRRGVGSRERRAGARCKELKFN